MCRGSTRGWTGCMAPCRPLSSSGLYSGRRRRRRSTRPLATRSSAMDRYLLPEQSAELYVLDVNTGDRRLVYRSSELLFEAPNWSSDGKWLVINADGLLFRLPVSGGTELEQIDLGG